MGLTRTKSTHSSALGSKQDLSVDPSMTASPCPSDSSPWVRERSQRLPVMKVYWPGSISSAADACSSPNHIWASGRVNESGRRSIGQRHVMWCLKKSFLSPWWMQLPLLKPASNRDWDYCHPAALSCMALNSLRMKAWKMLPDSVWGQCDYISCLCGSGPLPGLMQL